MPGNEYSGEDIMTLFLGKRGENDVITEEAVEVMAKEFCSGSMALLLERQANIPRMAADMKSKADLGSSSTPNLKPLTAIFKMLTCVTSSSTRSSYEVAPVTSSTCRAGTVLGAT